MVMGQAWWPECGNCFYCFHSQEVENGQEVGLGATPQSLPLCCGQVHPEDPLPNTEHPSEIVPQTGGQVFRHGSL